MSVTVRSDGGLSATVFGFLFGSVFSLHGIVPALWVHPFDAPLTLLLAPLAGGVLLLTLGLGLNALEAHWVARCAAGSLPTRR